jgi:purine-binding chemotaxis protein CheW
MAHVCMFRVHDQLLCLPVQQVQQVYETDQFLDVPRAPYGVVGLLNLRGLVVTVVDARVVFDLPPATEVRRSNVVTLPGGQPLCLLVDDVLGVLEIEDHEILSVPATIPPRRRALVQGVLARDEGLVLMLDAQRVAAAVRGTPVESVS